MLEQLKAKEKRSKWLLAGSVAALLVTAVSCETVTRTVMVTPNIPGAKFVGSKACAECHEERCKEFTRTGAPHARLMAKGPNAINMGCESCHGPGSLHVESGGERRTANNYRLNDPQAQPGVPLPTIVRPSRTSENCFQCHLDKQAQFALPSHHAVPEGRMSCSDCHDPHKGPSSVIKNPTAFTASVNEGCIRCHPAQRGPYVFEHQAMREGCTTCHDPHGTINQKMLTTRNQNLCMKCHMQAQTGPGTLIIGGVAHGINVQSGTCWTAGCHEAVHGSQVSHSLRF